MPCESLNDVLTLHWFTADRDIGWETHTNNTGAPVYNNHIDMSVSFLAVWLCVSYSWIWLVLQPECSCLKCVKSTFMSAPALKHPNRTYLVYIQYKLQQQPVIPLCSFRESRGWMNELKLSPMFPLGPQAYSWSKITFIESATCECGSACRFHKNHLKWHGVCFGIYCHYPLLILEVIPIALWVICFVPWTPT